MLLVQAIYLNHLNHFASVWMIIMAGAFLSGTMQEFISIEQFKYQLITLIMFLGFPLGSVLIQMDSKKKDRLSDYYISIYWYSGIITLAGSILGLVGWWWFK